MRLVASWAAPGASETLPPPVGGGGFPAERHYRKDRSGKSREWLSAGRSGGLRPLPRPAARPEGERRGDMVAVMLPLRDENPTRRFPIVTVALIALNVASFIYQKSLPEALEADLVMRHGLVPAFVTLLPQAGAGAAIPTASTFVTSMFLHGGLLHLLGNMLFLWVFGDNVEDRLGRGRFVLFYLTCGLAAAATQIVALPGSRVPMIGASGAISGVLGAYMLLFPSARVLTVIPIFIFLQFVKLPAIVLLGIWFLYQILNSLWSAPGEGGVAWFAHIGGFAAGLILITLFLPRRRHPPRAVRQAEWI